jgi:DNA polymerase-1
MEMQGVRLDIPKLKRWRAEVEMELRVQQGLLGDLNVKSGKQLQGTFKKLGIPIYNFTGKGNPCFDEESLKDTIVRSPHPMLQQILNVRWLRGLLEKFESYLEEVDSNGILHYHLHQCRSDGGGTVSGRYSSSAVNIQQVPSVDNQEEITRRWIVRELFLPAHGRTWCSADASQIEFRVFSHYANAEKLIQAYNSDSTTDFHKFVAEITGLDRKPAKNVNFMALYGGGRTKFMYMMKLAGQPVTEEQTEEFYEKYNSAFPEARKLLRKASDLAKRRGYVRTILGRRARFPEKQRLHSALNRIIQGSAADIMKSKLIQVYNHCRGYFDLRFTVHDEVDGDVDSPKDAERLSEVLNGFTPQIDVRVPIRWEVKTGKNWRLQ